MATFKSIAVPDALDAEVSSSEFTGRRAQTPAASDPAKPWSATQKVLFRIAFVFFIAMSLPNSAAWYKELVSLDWTALHYRDLYDVARFGSGLNWFGNRIFGSTLNGYATWIITLLFATAVGLLWTAFNGRKPTRDYRVLNYWLRAVVRYRAGIGIIGFGFTKLLPTQLPYPSLGVLNTNFGDLTLQKIYWLSIGIVPWYEVFTGVVEVLAGALLFFRVTTFWGSVLLFGALADIVYVNFAYDGGVHGYSSYFVLLSGFLLVDYLPSIYNLLIRERPSLYQPYYPLLDLPWQKWSRVGVKTAVLGVFLVLLFYLQLVNFWYDPYKQPAQKGLAELRGNYHVTEFKLNGQAIPYSPLDSLRWQQATFENWTTLTFKVNKPVELDLSNGGGAPMRDINRTFELTGVAGGQRVFYYEADTQNRVLYLQDKNRGANNREAREFFGEQGERTPRKAAKPEKPDNWIPKEALATIGPEDPKIEPIARSTRRTKGIAAENRPTKRNRMVLQYKIENGGDRVVLTGTDERQRPIEVTLDRYVRKYALSESTLKAGKYE